LVPVARVLEVFNLMMVEILILEPQSPQRVVGVAATVTIRSQVLDTEVDLEVVVEETLEEMSLLQVEVVMYILHSRQTFRDLHRDRDILVVVPAGQRPAAVTPEQVEVVLVVLVRVSLVSLILVVMVV
jgi:hypothetical protein